MGTHLCGQALLPPAEIFCPNLNLNSTQNHQSEGQTQNLKTGIHLEGKQKDLLFPRGPVPPSPPHHLTLILPPLWGPRLYWGCCISVSSRALGAPSPSVGQALSRVTGQRPGTALGTRPAE